MILTIGGNHQNGYSIISFDESVYHSLSSQRSQEDKDVEVKEVVSFDDTV